MNPANPKFLIPCCIDNAKPIRKHSFFKIYNAQKRWHLELILIWSLEFSRPTSQCYLLSVISNEDIFLTWKIFILENSKRIHEKLERLVKWIVMYSSPNSAITNKWSILFLFFYPHSWPTLTATTYTKQFFEANHFFWLVIYRVFLKDKNFNVAISWWRIWPTNSASRSCKKYIGFPIV